MVGFWLAEGGGGREMEARVASMAAWMADDGAEDWVLGMGMVGVASSGLKPANRLCALSGEKLCSLSLQCKRYSNVESKNRLS